MKNLDKILECNDSDNLLGRDGAGERSKPSGPGVRFNPVMRLESKDVYHQSEEELVPVVPNRSPDCRVWFLFVLMVALTGIFRLGTLGIVLVLIR